MRPRRTVRSTGVFGLPGGTEDNDAWVEHDTDVAGNPVLRLTFALDDEERQAIADGQNVELIIWGQGMPPVAMATTDVELKGAPR